MDRRGLSQEIDPVAVIRILSVGRRLGWGVSCSSDTITKPDARAGGIIEANRREFRLFQKSGWL